MFMYHDNDNTPTDTQLISVLSFLTIAHPENLAQQMGAQAHYNGYHQNDNPFGPGRPTFHVKYRRAWNSGWMQARWARGEI